MNEIVQAFTRFHTRGPFFFAHTHTHTQHDQSTMDVPSVLSYRQSTRDPQRSGVGLQRVSEESSRERGSGWGTSADQVCAHHTNHLLWWTRKQFDDHIHSCHSVIESSLSAPPVAATSTQPSSKNVFLVNPCLALPQTYRHDQHSDTRCPTAPHADVGSH